MYCFYAVEMVYFFPVKVYFIEKRYCKTGSVCFGHL